MKPARELTDSSTPEDAELSELIAKFDHRVRFFVHRTERRFGLASAWHDDLVSAGYWGLLKALRNRRGDAHECELSAYVSRRVEGAVIDEARSVLTRIGKHADIDPCDAEWGSDSGSYCASWLSDAAAEDPEECVDRESRWRQVEASFDGLDESQRRMLMGVAAGRSLAELAREGGDTPGRLQSRMARVARQVRARSPELRRLLRHEL